MLVLEFRFESDQRNTWLKELNQLIPIDLAFALYVGLKLFARTQSAYDEQPVLIVP